jgi:hypothetical protein
VRELVAAGLDLRVISGILRESEHFALVGAATEKLGARPQTEQAPPCAPRLSLKYALTNEQATVVSELQAICVESATVLGKRHRELTVHGKQLDVRGGGNQRRKKRNVPRSTISLVVTCSSQSPGPMGRSMTQRGGC